MTIVYAQFVPSAYKRLDGLPDFAWIPKRKINQKFQKYVNRLGFEPATSCVAIEYSNYLAIGQKEKLIKNLKKLTRLGFRRIV